MHYIKPILTAWLLIILSACSTYLPESDEENKDEPENLSGYTLRFSVQNDSGSDLNYPVSIYIFDRENTCISQENLSTAEDECSVQLPENKYTIAAFSGTDSHDYLFTNETTEQEYVRMTEKNYSDTPLQRAYSSINLNKPITVNLNCHCRRLFYILGGSAPIRGSRNSHLSRQFGHFSPGKIQ